MFAHAAGAAETPRRGGIIRLAFSSDWRSLDPAVAFDADSTPLQKMLFRGLLDFDDGINLVPDQASDWNISPDGKTYTFHLKPGVKFSNGREVKAEDYVFSFERILDPKIATPGQTYFMDILGAEEFNQGKAEHVRGLHAPDPRTFIVELKAANFTFRYVLAMNFADALPREVVKQYGADFQYHLTGSGPYRVAEWRRNVRWRFERNPYYSGHDGYVDGVDIMLGVGGATETMMIARNELDRTSASPADAAAYRRDPRLRPFLQLVDTANTDYMFMNSEIKPFDDVRVRQALNYAVDKPRLIKLNGGFGKVANGIVPPSMPWSNPSLPVYTHDPAKARALLREAGYTNGFKTELWYYQSGVFDRIAQAVQQDLRALNIELELKIVSYAAFEAKVGERKQVPLGLWGWMEDYPDPSDFLDVLLNGERITDRECNNVAFYNNPAVNKLLAQAGASLDVDERTRRYREAETLMMQDAPWVPVMNEQIPMVNNPRLHGMDAHPVWLWRYEKMWLDP